MNLCNLEYIYDITNAIEMFFELETDQSLQNLEKYVKGEIPGLNQDFSLETYIANSFDFKENFQAIVELHELSLAEYLPNLNSAQARTKSNITPNFSSSKISDLYHTLPLVKEHFEGMVNSSVIKEIIIGDKKSKTYVETDEEVSANISSLKNRLFNTIQDFLSKKGILKEEIKPLYNENGDLNDYSHYKRIMNMLDHYFFNAQNFTLIPTYSGKKIPNIDMDITVENQILEAYNAGAFLSNFDTVLAEYFSGIVDINYGLFNNLRTNTGSNKYRLKIEGLKTEYWKKDDHESEGSETSESKLAKLLISTIPFYNKKKENLGIYMEMKDFYLFAAKLTDFEILYGNKLKNQNNTSFKYFNEDPKAALLWYITEIMNAVDNKKGSLQELKEIFEDVYEFSYSLKKYIESEEFNILEKESNSKESVLNMFAQVINNSFGASYSKTNADGSYKIQEMYKQNFNSIQLQNTILANMFNAGSVTMYDSQKVEEHLTKILKGWNENPLLAPNRSKVSLTSFIKEKTGITLSYVGFNDFIAELNIGRKTPVTTPILKTILLDFISQMSSDFAGVDKNIKDGVLKNTSTGDVSVTKYIPLTIKHKVFKAISRAYLFNNVVKPVMNVTTFSGEKLPTFKMATLTQKDAELFDLQRNFERKNKDYTKFRSLLITDTPAILGTGTKLELVNGDVNKSAAKFSIAENFISDFQFDFLQNLISNNQFSIMIGNYSDKSTVLTKIINGDFVFNAKKNNVPLISLDIKTILGIVRLQAENYYTDLLNKIFKDYELLLGIKKQVDPDLTIKKINEALKTTNIRTLSQKASDLKINFTEELHYSVYNKIPSLNQLIVDNYRIFKDNATFLEFVERQEKSMLNKFELFGKTIGNGKKLVFAGNFNIQDALTKLNIKKEEFKVVTKKDKVTETPDYLALEGVDGLNPILKKWMWINALFRNEYLFLTGKGEYMHPHKLKGDLAYRGDLNGFKDKKNKDWYWLELEKEMSGRLSSMAKRNVMYTATIEVPVRQSRYGIPENINHATIEDHKTQVYNLVGNSKEQEAHDGSSFMNYVYSLMLDKSFPGKGYSGTKKQFGTFITEYGATIKKDAESVISNNKILDSANSEIKYFQKQRKSLSIPIGNINFEFTRSFNNEYFFYKNGERFKINKLIIKDNTYSMVVSKFENETWKIQKDVVKGTYNTLFNLWTLFGAQYSTDEDGNFNEGSNELLYEVVTTPDINNNYPLKDKMIHVISNLSAMKAGGTNVNPATAWTDENTDKLAYFTFSNRFMGPQLDASHEADDSKIKEVTQVISALAQNTSTAHLAKEAYEDIANVIKNAAKPYLKYLKPGQKINKTDLYHYLAEKFVDTINNSKGDTIAKVLVHAFGKDFYIPFSNQNFFTPFVRDVITRMNNEFITRYYSGTGAVLIPSHGAIKVYEIPQKDGTFKIAKQSDLVKEALKNHDSTKTISSTDKVIWGHPAIGKTFLHQKGMPDIIDFDSVYKSRINKELGLPKGTDGLKERQAFRKKNPDVYNQKIKDLWQEAKADAQQSGKTLLASDLILLREFADDFNKIINMPADLFVERSAQRGETDAEDKLKWKAGIDEALQNIDQSKILTTTSYIADLFARNNDEIISGYTNNLLKPLPTTWDKIQIGDTILVLEEVEDYDHLEHGLIADDIHVEEKTKASRSDPTKINKTYEFSLNNKPNEIFELVKDLEENQYSIHFKTTGKDSLTKLEKERLIGNIHSFLPPKAEISTWSDQEHNITKGDISGIARFLDVGMVDSGKTRTNWFEGKPIELPVYKFPTKLVEKSLTLSTPALYYKYKTIQTFAPLKEGEVFDPKQPVIKIMNKPRDLKPSEASYTNINGLQKNLFDFESVRLRYEFEKLSKKMDLTNKFYPILNDFFKYMTGGTIELSDALATEEETTIKFMIQKLNKWTQRNLDLLDLNKEMKSIDEVGSFEKLFNGEKLELFFKDAAKLYDNSNSQIVSNYKFSPAELILGDIYQGKFNRDINDSMYEISKQGFTYFYNKLESNFSEDNTDADIKLHLSTLDTPVYIRYTDVLPGNDYKYNITAERPLDDETLERRFVRRNQKGDIVYTIPNNDTVRVREVDGKEVIFIKALSSVKAGEKKIFNKVASFENDLSTLLSSFKGNIISFVPLMNGLPSDTSKISSNEYRPFQKELNWITLNSFARISGYNTVNSNNLNSLWFEKNKKDILLQLSKKMFASWQKSHEFIASRIPSQSMQSFMEMRNIGYMNSKSNDAYVSIWQIWLQGSDFDIDKAYMLGSGFSSNGQFETWSNVSNYSTKEQLDLIEKLPIPTGQESILSDESNIPDIDISADVEEFFKMTAKELFASIKDSNIQEELDKLYKLKELTPKQLIILNKILRQIKNIASNNPVIKINLDSVEEAQLFIKVLNKHNLSKQHIRKEHAIKNSIVSRIKQIISTPSNQLLANSPVDIDDWHAAAKKALDKRNKPKVYLSSYDMFSMYKQQRDASVGKDDVGIAANGLKVFFALSTYYNDYYENGFNIDKKNISISNKSFVKDFNFSDNDPLKLSTISDVGITLEQEDLLRKTFGNLIIHKNQAALALSGFTSAATDNAKELLMSKINASVELASMHIYLLILGFTPEKVADIMTSELMEEIIEKLESNLFFSNKTGNVGSIFEKTIDALNKTLNGKQEKSQVLVNKLNDFKVLYEIFQGAQEIKLLAKILSANQKAPANIEEINKFLTNFEQAIYAREHNVFGYDLKDFDTWDNYKDSPDPARKTDAINKFNGLVAKIFENNKQLDINNLKHVEHVKKVLKDANKIKVTYNDWNGKSITKEVSLLGGKFDFKYFASDENVEYKRVSKEYYNLIKSTFNVFDIIDIVPHFKEMISGLMLSHKIMSTASVKYHFAFTLLKDTIRKNADRIVFTGDSSEINSHIKNQMGNYALYPKITPLMVSKGLGWVDTRLKSEWLKSEDTKDLVLNVTQLLKQLNDENRLNNKSIITKFEIYTSDDARIKDRAEQYSKVVTENDEEDTIIDLKSNYGIANFKKVMEQILLPLLQKKSNILLDSLKIENVTNVLGIRASAIMSSFPLSSINNVVAKARSQKLIKAFNNLDIENDTKNLVKNADNTPLKWRDLFYVYNLLVNNDKYGEKRLTPLFEYYMKEPTSYGYNYISFSSKIDSGELDLFNLEKELEQNAEYIETVETKNIKLQEEIVNKLTRELENDILFYALNKGGNLTIGRDRQELSVTNGDFVVVTSITETPESKKTWTQLNEVLRLIKNRGFIIKFEC